MGPANDPPRSNDRPAGEEVSGKGRAEVRDRHGADRLALQRLGDGLLPAAGSGHVAGPSRGGCRHTR